jgi:hypothetical protein
VISYSEWLLAAEEHGLAIFGCGTGKHCAKAFVFTSRTVPMLPVVKHPFLSSIHGGFSGTVPMLPVVEHPFLTSIHGGFVTDRVRASDVEMHDTVDAVSLSGDDRMSTFTTDATRKRKEGIEDDTKVQLKYMRCQLHENAVRENSCTFKQQ